MRARTLILLPLVVCACEPDTSDDTSPEAWAPELACPGDPTGVCDSAEGPWRAGAAKASILPDCYEVWLPEGEDHSYSEGTDAFADCGCDRLCPEDEGYPGPDEGEGDGELQAVWIAGFGNARAASGVRDASLGLRGENDGLWARAVVIEQGETSLAIVTLDLVGFFHDQVDQVAQGLAEAGHEVDHLLIHSTHNHQGPDTMGMWGESITRTGIDQDYLAQVRATVVDVVGEALADTREVELSAGEVDV